MTIYKLPGSAIESNTITITQIQTTAVTNIVTQSGPRVSSLIYPGNDTAGNTVGGQTVYINGSGFETNNAIYINGNAVPSKSFISASNLSFTTPALAAGIYPVYLINTDSGATAIFVPGYISSAEPSWVTSAGSLSGSQDELSAWSYSLSATGDAPITYALAAGSSLPTGVSLAANGLISGTITSPSGNATTYTFSVVASDAQNQDSTRQFTVTTSTGEGALFANNVLLIHADGTNNQNNHTFLDSSNNNFTITRNGNATQGTFSPFSQTGWSGYFDGTEDYLTFNASSSCAFGTSDFTVEFWLYPQNNNVNIMDVRPSQTAVPWGIDFTSGNIPSWYNGGSNQGSTAISQQNWSHVAFCRQGTTHRIFLNGIQTYSWTDSTNYGTMNSSGRIGASLSDTRHYAGYISNLRIVKGTAVYTTTFTPPTAPLAPIANTSLLTLQSNRFVDEGPNSFTITRAGDASIQPFSPFSSGLLSSNSHSVYFDGTGDYLTYSPGSTLSSIGTGPLTIEAWVYYTGNHSGFHDIFVTSTSLGMLLDAGKLRFYGFSAATAATNLVQNTWVHVAVVRQSSNVFGFIGGTKVLDTTTNVGFSGSTGYIGSWTSGTTENWPGYISNLRVSNSARYTANFTPSTTQFTSDANTALLTCQSATVIDNSPNAFTITRNGDAIPRTFNPFGQTFNANIAYSTANVGGGAYFDGSGDYLSIGNNAAFDITQGDFTLETWVYKTGSLLTEIFNHRTNSPSAGYLFRLNANNTLLFSHVAGSSINSGANSFPSFAWNHIALTRSGSTGRLFINGALVGSGTITNGTTASTSLKIGVDEDNNNSLQGYLSNHRIIKGTALYTNPFIPPSAPFTNIANTSLLCNFTNAGIFDQTAKNILETVGDAKVSTAQYKYGTGSMVFDGTGDYLKTTPNTAILTFGTGDLTLECWIYQTATSTSTYRVIFGDNVYGSAGGYTLYSYNNALNLWKGSGGGGAEVIAPAGTITLNTWTHVAWTRSGSSNRLFINGTQVGNTTTDATNYTSTASFIGASQTGNLPFAGYIDDLRITKGYARYTSTFTAPTSALKDK